MELRGYPLKVYSNRSLYIPRNLCRVYGFHEDTLLIRREIPGGYFFRPFDQNCLRLGEKAAALHREFLHLPAQWLIQNHLIPGKSNLYLTATDQGFYLMISPEFSIG